LQVSHLHYLEQVLAEGSVRVRMDRAALDLASIHFPDLEPEPFLDRLNDLASSLGDRLRNFNDGRDFVEKASSYLFGELGFHGNETDFFDPRNSCLNQVLERRTGIPITLAVMYMEIARRLHMPVFGIGLPRHFVLEFNDGNFATYIDPFRGGRAITAEECFALAGAKVADPILLQRSTPKQIAMRMLQNLHGVYLRTQDSEKAIATLDLLLQGAPEIASWYKRRGMLSLELKRYHAARRDLLKYLELEPDATDREAIQQQLQAIHLWLAQVS
jgi:regulator of sirC expression with transglutaminase-like and TPR domain